MAGRQVRGGPHHPICLSHSQMLCGRLQGQKLYTVGCQDPSLPGMATTVLAQSLASSPDPQEAFRDRLEGQFPHPMRALSRSHCLQASPVLVGQDKLPQHSGFRS